MKKINEIVIGMITILVLAGCGADSDSDGALSNLEVESADNSSPNTAEIDSDNDSSLNSSDTETEDAPTATEVVTEIDTPTATNADIPVSRFDINDYQAVENSTSIEGLWVGVSNYSEVIVHTGDDEGLVDTNRHSKRRIFNIVGDARQESKFYEDHLLYGLMSLTIKENNIHFEITDGLLFEGLELIVTVSDNNKMAGTISSDTGDRLWEFVKISNSVETIGTVSIESHWTNAQSTNEELNALVIFDEILESTNNAGESLYEHNYYISLGDTPMDESTSDDLLFAKEDLLNTANDEFRIVRENDDFSNVEVSASQSNSTSFMGVFSAINDTDSSSVELTVNLSF